MTKNKILLSTAYIPPVQYFTKLILTKEGFIEKHDSYQKQTYRNRCHIYSPNGLQVLSIPVIKNHGTKTKVKDIEISYAENWYLNHLRSFEAAYRSSPFYEFYMPEMEEILRKKNKFLIDLNHQLLLYLNQSLDIEIIISYSDDFIMDLSNITDFRDIIHPKKKYTIWDEKFKPISYYQVFQEKYGFIENLSIIDLLFNEGPNAMEILKSSIL